MDIFWSPAYPTVDTYAEQNMLYREPDLLTLSTGHRESLGALAVHGLNKALDNVYVVRSTVYSQVVLQNNQFTPADQKSHFTAQFFSPAPPLRHNFARMSMGHQILFFSMQPVNVLFTGAYFHLTEIQSRLIFTPRMIDISKILFPIGVNFEFHPNTNQFKFNVGDPLYYAHFQTPEPIRFRRFRYVSAISEAIVGCLVYDRHRPNSTLEETYQAFIDSDVRERVGKLILENVLNDGGV